MKRTATLAISTPSKRVKFDSPAKRPKLRNRQFRRLIGDAGSNAPELKYNDIATANYVADTTGTVTLLNGISQGSDNTNRIGRVMVMKSVHVRGIVSPVDSSTGNTLARLILVWDSDTDGVAPTVTDILQTANSTSPMNLNNRGRFTVLANEEFFIGGISTTATMSYAQSPSGAVFDRFVKLPGKGCRTINSGTGATVASIQQGAIWMVTIGDRGANDGGTFSVYSRVRFTDA